jgi:hypothetical protein
MWNGDKMCRGYISSVGIFWPSRPSRSSRPTRPSRSARALGHSSECNVKGVSNVLGITETLRRWWIFVSSFCGDCMCNSFCHCRHGLCSHRVVTACIVDWLKSEGCPLFDTSGIV